jgi:Delta24-sterol reductase
MRRIHFSFGWCCIVAAGFDVFASVSFSALSVLITLVSLPPTIAGSAVSSNNNDTATTCTNDQVHWDEYYLDLAAQLLQQVAPGGNSNNNNKNHNDTMTAVALSMNQHSSQVRSKEYKQDGSQKLLNVQDLSRVLEINTDTNTVRVQARCTYDALVKATLRTDSPDYDDDGLAAVPLVVPEFKSITVGGAIVGGALESTSFRFGQVSDDGLLQVTVLLGNGTIVTLTKDDELLHALPGSYGSLAIVLEAVLQLQPVKRVVHVLLHQHTSIGEGIDALVHLAMYGTQDFLDALHFPSGELVVLVGNLVDETPHQQLIDLEELSGLWFYEHVQGRIRNKSKVPLSTTDQGLYLPIYDYLFRYERGAFWMSRPMRFSWRELVQNPMLLGPFVTSWRRTRALFGHFFTATKLYRVLHKMDATAVQEKFVLLDAYLPASHAAEYLEYIRSKIPVTVPVWLCPVKPALRSQPLSPNHNVKNENMLINVAVWGRVSDNKGAQYTRQLEEKMLELGGRKMMYSQSDMTSVELYSRHVDGEHYRSLRHRYGSVGVFAPLHVKLQLDQPPKQKGAKYWFSRLVL